MRLSYTIPIPHEVLPPIKFSVSLRFRTRSRASCRVFRYLHSNSKRKRGRLKSQTMTPMMEEEHKTTPPHNGIWSWVVFDGCVVVWRVRSGSGGGIVRESLSLFISLSLVLVYLSHNLWVH